MRGQKSILIFGGGVLQKSIIEKCKEKDLFVILVDPDENPYCKNIVDKFYVVGGKDFDLTLKIAKKYNISGVLTSSSDKPLVMMARVATELKLPFFSVNTAIVSTDKLLMKNIFIKEGIPCAKGLEMCNGKEYDGGFPVIVKPRDNSGSRGVIFCESKDKLIEVFEEVKKFTKKESILVEEYVKGEEYSIETIHVNGSHKVIQYTEKIITSFPYNVELGHIQPANLSDELKLEINKIISKIGDAFKYVNCVSHTELKVYRDKIIVIETSPRLGGDFITSHLVPLSTGIDLENILIDISMSQFSIDLLDNQYSRASMIYYFNLPTKNILKLNLPEEPQKEWNLDYFSFRLNEGDRIPLIKNSLNRYGEVIFSGDSYKVLFKKREIFLDSFSKIITVN